MSAPMCDAFLVLAQAPGGLSCFFMPRWMPDGTLNAIRIQRLKDKLGNKSNASSEVEFENAWARLIGEEGRGIPNIIEMGNYTRLDCAIGSAGLMRQAVAQSVHHETHRTAYQKTLADQPLMNRVLADLALEAEAAMVLALRLARAYDRQDDPSETAFRRLVTPAAKYWICKRGPMLAAEAMEVLGGNGYVEESVMPRLYREAPVNSIWEGSGNIMCLDVLRALGRGTEAGAALRAELAAAHGGDGRLDRFVVALEANLARSGSDEGEARRLVEAMVLALQATLLIKGGPSTVAEAFCASRLARDWGHAFGTLPEGELRAIVARAPPQIATRSRSMSIPSRQRRSAGSLSRSNSPSGSISTMRSPSGPYSRTIRCGASATSTSRLGFSPLGHGARSWSRSRARRSASMTSSIASYDRSGGIRASTMPSTAPP